MEAALEIAEQILRAPDRVGSRHDRDVAQNAALGLGLPQFGHQRMDGHHARQLAGMERCLYIG